MTFHKKALALARVATLTLATAARAQESDTAPLPGFASVTLSGYVDTSAQWNPGGGTANYPPYRFGGAGKANGFNLDVVQLTLEKPLGEEAWSAGYRVDLWFGPDANALGTKAYLGSGSYGSASDLAIRQAYVALHTPLGNGMDWKLGVFDSIIGYESIVSPNDPNYTRSYGNTIEPQTHTGLEANYPLSQSFSVAFGVANTVYPAINSRPDAGSTGVANGLYSFFAPGAPSPALPGQNAYAASYLTYMGAVAWTLPEWMGFLSGSTLYGGAVNGYDNSVIGSGAGMPQLNVYAGAVLATPFDPLTLGVAYDLLHVNSQFTGTPVKGEIWTLAGYASYQATRKLSLHCRFEVANASLDEPATASFANAIYATTATLRYDLWKNVLSRLEFRWDHANHGDLFGGTASTGPDRADAFLLAGNVIYKF